MRIAILLFLSLLFLQEAALGLIRLPQAFRYYLSGKLQCFGYNSIFYIYIKIH